MIPFGGYVRLYGEFPDPENPSIASNPESFIQKPWYVQAIVIASGALFNFLLAIVLFTIMFIYGVPGYPTTTIEKIVPGSPAEKAGIAPGDKLLQIDEKQIKEWNDLSDYVSKHPGKNVTIVLRRDGSTVKVVAKLENKDGRGFLGVQSKTTVKRLNIIDGFLESVKLTASFIVSFAKILYTEAFKGDLLKQSTGPVGIVMETSKAIKVGFDFYLFLLGLISINLGFVNLLPIPPLDGGRLAVIFIEKLTGKKLSLRVLAFLQLLGILLFIYLMVYLLIADVQKYHLLKF